MASSSAAGGRDASQVACVADRRSDGAAAAASGPGSSAWTSSGAPSAAQHGQRRLEVGLADVLELGDARGREEALEAEHAGLAAAAAARPALPGTTPPQKPTSTAQLPVAPPRAWPRARRRWWSAGTLLSGMSTRVVTPPAAAAAGGGGEALPLGAARLVDVDVGVDEAGQDDAVAEIAQLGARRHVIPAAHRRDPLAGHVHGGRLHPVAEHDAAAAEDERRAALARRVTAAA